MIKTTDYTREIKLFHKIVFSSPNSVYLCISSKKNLNISLGLSRKKYLKEIMHIGSVRIYNSLRFPFWILTLLIVKKILGGIRKDNFFSQFG